MNLRPPSQSVIQLIKYHCVPSTVLDTRDTSVNKTKTPAFLGHAIGAEHYKDNNAGKGIKRYLVGAFRNISEERRPE